MKNKIAPEINAGSMADIAFLLLVFFLVVTTIENDFGLIRKLPSKEEVNSKQISERNVLNVWINSQNEIMINGNARSLNEVFDVVCEFVTNPRNDETLPEMELKEINELGPMLVSKQVISLQSDKETSYATYINVQNEIARAYNHLRDEMSQSRFQKNHADLKNGLEMGKYVAVRKVYPMRISEAVPFDSK